MKVCTKEHVSESFGVVPKGSLWDDDADVVAETPDAFSDEGALKKSKAPTKPEVE